MFSICDLPTVQKQNQNQWKQKQNAGARPVLFVETIEILT